MAVDSEVETPPHNLNMFSTSVPITVPAFPGNKKTALTKEINIDSNVRQTVLHI